MFYSWLTVILNLKKPSNEDNQVTPSAAIYIRKGVKATALSLKSLSRLVPVPMVSEFLEVVIRVLESCDVCVLV
jgi:hypothetical protein